MTEITEKPKPPINHLAKLNFRWLSIIAGSLILNIWTMIRFFSKPSTFDLVGQHTLAHQWLNNMHDGSMIGMTNYIYKIFLFYIPFDLLSGSPRLKLVLLTIFINTLAFFLIVFFLEKIWLLYNKTIPKLFYLVVLWIGFAAGSIFWVQYTNSRNIEIGLGLCLVYLLLSMRNLKQYSKYILVLVLGSFLFFADPLQLYMSAVPALACIYLFAILDKKQRKNKLKIAAIASILVVLSYVFSKLLFLLFEKMLNIKFIIFADQRAGKTVFEVIFDNMLPYAKQLARFYSGGHELGKYIWLVNFALFVSSMLIFAFFAFKKYLNLQIFTVVFVFFCLNSFVYIASGQPSVEGTSRYLIMTAPFFVLVLTTIVSTKSKLATAFTYIYSAILCLNIAVLVSILVKSYDADFSIDNHIKSSILYMNKYDYGYSSMMTTLPAYYMSNNHIKLLPLSCEPGGILVPTTLFFDKQMFNNSESIQQETPIILDGNTIQNTPNVCDINAIKNKFGEWSRVEYLTDGSMVLIYPSNVLQIKPN